MKALTPIVLFYSKMHGLDHIHALAPCMSGDDFAVQGLQATTATKERFLEHCSAEMTDYIANEIDKGCFPPDSGNLYMKYNIAHEMAKVRSGGHVVMIPVDLPESKDIELYSRYFVMLEEG